MMATTLIGVDPDKRTHTAVVLDLDWASRLRDATSHLREVEVVRGDLDDVPLPDRPFRV